MAVVSFHPIVGPRCVLVSALPLSRRIRLILSLVLPRCWFWALRLAAVSSYPCVGAPKVLVLDVILTAGNSTGRLFLSELLLGAPLGWALPNITIHYPCKTAAWLHPPIRADAIRVVELMNGNCEELSRPKKSLEISVIPTSPRNRRTP